MTAEMYFLAGSLFYIVSGIWWAKYQRGKYAVYLVAAAVNFLAGCTWFAKGFDQVLLR